MSAQSWSRLSSKVCLHFSTALLLAGSVLTAHGQMPAAPRVEIFGGYSYLYPHTAVTGTLPGGLLPISTCLCAIPGGGGASLTYNFNRWFGMTADGSVHFAGDAPSTAQQFGKSSFQNVSFGPRITYRSSHFSPFAEALFGVNRLSPKLFSPDSEFGVLAGGGLDWNVAKHVAIRVAQADFVYSNHHFGINPATAGTNLRGVRLQAGVVFAFGGHAHHADAPVAAVPLAAAPAPVAQAALAAPLPIVAALAAPTVMCVANPSVMNAGESSTITATGSGTQPLVYSFNADAGSISGSNSTAMLSSVGAHPGAILVTCNVADSTGRTAFSTTTVTLKVVAQPVATASDLCSASFARDAFRPTRVNNEAKACLDDVALNMQRNSEATLVLIGHAASTEHHGQKLAAERAVNTKAYLVQEKGLAPERIRVSAGKEDGKSVSIILVPLGVTRDAGAETPLDENVVKPQARSALRRKSLNP